MKPLHWSLGADRAEEAWHQLKKFSPRKNGISIMHHGEVLGGPKVSLELAQTAMGKAFEILGEYGYKAVSKNRAHFTSTDLTVAWGNIGIHTDDGLGKIALVLLRIDPLSRSQGWQFTDSPYETKSYLWTRHGLTPVEEGDMVVFDTDQEHAWFCPGVATFLSIAVTKSKKPARGLS